MGGRFSPWLIISQTIRDTTMKLGSNYHQLMENLLIVSIFNKSSDPLLGNWFSEGRYAKMELFS